MNNPLVSILIPVYNRADLVGYTIDTALQQTYSNIEIVIVDNFSTDATWEVLQKYKQKDDRIKIYQNEINIGPVLNWKRCIDLAKGEYAKILFSDDLISENFIEETSNYLINYKDVGFVISKIFMMNIDENKKYNKQIKNNLDDKFSFLSGKKFIYKKIFGRGGLPNSPGCALFRTKDLKNSLIIDIPNYYKWDFKKYGAGNDLLIFLNIADNYKRIILTDAAYSIFRGHKESFSTSNSLKKYYDYSKYYFTKKSKRLWLAFFLFIFIKYVKRYK